MTERKEPPREFRVAFLIGRGSRLPNILDNVLFPNSPIKIPLVVSHRKPEDNQEDVVGIAYAKKLGIPTVYWNLIQMHQAHCQAIGKVDIDKFRPEYMRALGAFLSQQYYKADLILMTGWDLILDENFLAFFGDIPVLNVHPHYLPDPREQQDKVFAPDGTPVPVLRGTEVWVKAIEDKLAWSGVTIHQIIPSKYDVGQVIGRAWVKIDPKDTAKTLREKLNKLEDKLVPTTILGVATRKITL